MNVYGAMVEWYCLDTTAALRQTCLSAAVFPLKIPHEMAQDWPQAYVIRGQWLATSALYEGSYTKHTAYVNVYSLQYGLDVRGIEVWFLMG